MWTKRATSRLCQIARRTDRRRFFRQRLASEQLEQRLLLDGTGLIGLLLANSEPDSRPGDDPHVDTIGPDASMLEFARGNHARVNSYIDSAADVDVFQFAASGETLRVAGLLVAGEAAVHVLDDAGQNVAAVDENFAAVEGTEPGDGFIQCEWGDFGFCDFFPTTPGETYFVTIGGHRVETSEYFLDFFQNTQPVTPTVSEPDSQSGDDPHPEQVDGNATVLEFDGQDSLVTVDSFLDRPGDIDVFQFQATSARVNIHASTVEGNLNLSLEVLNQSGDIVASNVSNDELHFVARPPEPFVEPLTVPGELYFLRVSAGEGEFGRYLLDIVQVPSVLGQVANPDSRPGEDPHADGLGADATALVFDALDSHAMIATVNSFVDEAGDIDTFQFTARDTSVTISAYSSFDGLVALHDSARNLIARSEVQTVDLAGGASFARVSASLNEGELYYVRVTGKGDAVGQYVLNILQPPDSNDRVVGIGDANFDGTVDATDFAVWNRHKFQQAWGPQQGDFNGDGVADAADFNIWNHNRFTRLAASGEGDGSDRVPRAPAGLANTDRPAVAPATMSRSMNPTAKYAALTAQKVDHVMRGASAAYADNFADDFADNEYVFAENQYKRRNSSSSVPRQAACREKGRSWTALADAQHVDEPIADFANL
jgi:hypothetical protein